MALTPACLLVPTASPRMCIFMRLWVFRPSSTYLTSSRTQCFFFGDSCRAPGKFMIISVVVLIVCITSLLQRDNNQKGKVDRKQAVSVFVFTFLFASQESCQGCHCPVAFAGCEQLPGDGGASNGQRHQIRVVVVHLALSDLLPGILHFPIVLFPQRWGKLIISLFSFLQVQAIIFERKKPTCFGCSKKERKSFFETSAEETNLLRLSRHPRNWDTTSAKTIDRFVWTTSNDKIWCWRNAHAFCRRPTTRYKPFKFSKELSTLSSVVRKRNRKRDDVFPVFAVLWSGKDVFSCADG